MVIGMIFKVTCGWLRFENCICLSALNSSKLWFVNRNQDIFFARPKILVDLFLEPKMRSFVEFHIFLRSTFSQTTSLLHTYYWSCFLDFVPTFKAFHSKMFWIRHGTFWFGFYSQDFRIFLERNQRCQNDNENHFGTSLWSSRSWYKTSLKLFNLLNFLNSLKLWLKETSEMAIKL